MKYIVFSVLFVIALSTAVCAISDTSSEENLQDVGSLIGSRDRRSFHFLKHWLHKLNPHRVIDKIFHRHQEKEDSNANHWKTKTSHWSNGAKPEPTEKSTPKFDFSSVYPGTNWCGSHVPDNGRRDLGWKWGPDTCCRRHHKCSHSVGPKEEKYGLENFGLFTWFHCDCDREFYECLKGDNSPDADAIGDSYFNDLNNYCIYKDYQQHCTKWLFKAKCRKLTTKSKIWQKRKISLTYA